MQWKYYTFYGYWVFFQVEAFQFSKFHEDMSKLDKSNLRETWAWHSRFQKVLNSRKVCWNNFLTSQWLILLYYFYQKILKEKTAILENIMHIFFTFFGITISLYKKACLHNLCMNHALLDHESDRLSWTSTTLLKVCLENQVSCTWLIILK